MKVTGGDSPVKCTHIGKYEFRCMILNVETDF